MTRTSTTHTWSNTTVATYKTSMQPLSDSLNAVLTKTGDSGQVSWTAVTTLPTSGAVRDFEVFRFSDTLQATSPVFIRADYIAGATIPTVQFTVGTSTDGAGNITGAMSTPSMSCYSSSSYSGVTTPTVYASSDGTYLTFAFNLSPTSTGFASWGGAVIERFRANDGTATGDGFMVWIFDTNSNQNGVLSRQYARVVGAASQPGNEITPSVAVPGLSTMSSTFSGNSATAYPFHGYGPTPRGASQALLAGYATELPRLSEVTLTHYGKAAKFLPLGSAARLTLPVITGVQSAPITTGLSQVLSPLLRWE